MFYEGDYMQVFVMIEPAFQHSFWCKQVLNGIVLETKRRKYSLRFVGGEDYHKLNYDLLFGDETRQIITIGTSISWMPDVLRVFEHHNIHALLVNYDSPNKPSSYSVVRMDYINAMQNLMGYYYHYNRRKIALFGFNPNSSADRIKEQFFNVTMRSMGDDNPQRSIFHNYGDIRACFARFLSHAHLYNALICANDLVAVSALNQLLDAGINVPEQIFLAGFGESMLTQLTIPTITTVTLDHEGLGQQAVKLYAFLHRQNNQVLASIRMASKLAIRQSTQNLPANESILFSTVEKLTKPVDFYHDKEIQMLLAVENFYNRLDTLDMEILNLLKKNVSIEDIADICHSSVSTIGYRIRNMQAYIGANSRSDLMDWLAESF